MDFVRVRDCLKSVRELECFICRVDFEKDARDVTDHVTEARLILPCGHFYGTWCVRRWSVTGEALRSVSQALDSIM